MSLSQTQITQRLMLACHVDSKGGIQDVFHGHTSHFPKV